MIGNLGTNETIQSFQDKFGEAHMYLACQAALPMALTPDLLYNLRANFNKDIHGEDLQIPWIAVADILLSSLCKEVGRELFEMEQKIRGVLLEQLNSDPRFNKNKQKRIKRIAHFLLIYVQDKLNNPINSVRNLAIVQRWTALAYINPEEAARDLALQLTNLSLNEKTEWVRMSKVADTLAEPLIEAEFKPLLTYLQGMRDLAKGSEQKAASKFEQLSTNDGRIVIAGVNLTVPQFEKSEWNINEVPVTLPPLHQLEFESAKLTKQPRSLNLGSKWVVNRQRGRTEAFDEQLGRRADVFSELSDLGIVLKMVQIPGGEFLMGSADNERNNREQPQHLVMIAPFFLSRITITQSQWKIIAESTKVRRELNPNPSKFSGDNLPVEQITWFEAIEFCERLQLLTARPYRLPSEAEWEYACRAGTDTAFCYGETISPEVATYDSTQKYKSSPKAKSPKQTSEVDKHQVSNTLGLSDMHGNVWEWCADHWDDSYENAPNDGTALLTDNTQWKRVVSGGCWQDPPIICRSRYRNGISPSNKIITIGFRVALSL